MSRLFTLPTALRIELVERERDDSGAILDEHAIPLEGPAFVDVGRAQAVYAIGTDAIVEMNAHRYYRFAMQDEVAACAAVRTIANVAAGARR